VIVGLLVLGPPLFTWLFGLCSDGEY